MADAIRFAPLLFVAVAADPTAAEPVGSNMKLQSFEAVRLHEPPSPRNDPALRLRLFPGDETIVPTWTLPFGTQADQRERGGVSFSIRPGRGVKASAKIRF